jgi:hypothetical protein
MHLVVLHVIISVSNIQILTKRLKKGIPDCGVVHSIALGFEKLISLFGALCAGRVDKRYVRKNIQNVRSLHVLSQFFKYSQPRI